MANTEKIEQLRTRAQREIDEGLLPSCQLAVALDGEVIHHEAFGDATTDDRYVIFSSTKPIVASAVWLLIQSGELDVSRTVASYIPEFGANGKDAVTVEQVMLHTSGFPHAPLGAPQWWTRDGRVRRFAEWRLNWEPGSLYEYHPTSAHWVLAEISDRVTGREYCDLLEERITGPVGIERILGVPECDQHPHDEARNVGEAATPDELEAVLGFRELPKTTATADALLELNEPDARALGVPGGGGVARACDVVTFYQALLRNPGELWDPAVLADATGNVRNPLPDRWTRVTANRTLGLIVAGDDGKSNVRGFGHTNSARTFGHNGAGGQIAWADPESGLSFCYLTNGMDQHVIRQGRRGIALSSYAAVC